MTITRISYRRLISTGEYSNVSIGADADLEPGETPEDALMVLTAWVQGQVSQYQERDRLHEDVYEKRRELERIERQMIDARQSWANMQAWLTKHGIDLPARFRDDDMPF